MHHATKLSTVCSKNKDELINLNMLRHSMKGHCLRELEMIDNSKIYSKIFSTSFTAHHNVTALEVNEMVYNRKK